MLLTLNKNKSSFKAISDLINYIKKISKKNSNFCRNLNDISKNTQIPSKVLTQKLSQIVFRKFDFKKIHSSK